MRRLIHPICYTFTAYYLKCIFNRTVYRQFIVINIYYLYNNSNNNSAIKSVGTKVLLALGYDCLNRWVLRCRLKVSAVRQDLTSDGSEFQVCGATTEKDQRANSVVIK